MKKTEDEIDNQAEVTGSPNEGEPLVRLEASTITDEQLEELTERAAKSDERWEKLLRTTADFETSRRGLRAKTGSDKICE